MQFTRLTADDRSHFEQHGYLIVPNALTSDQVARLIAASDRLIASDERRGRQTLDNGRYDSFRNVVARDPAFLELLTHPATAPLVVQLLSPNIQLHTSHLIYKQADHPDECGRRSPGWHRDINTCPNDLGHRATPRLEIKVCFQLSNASQPGCGQTLLARGSHRLTTDLLRHADGDPDAIVEPLLSPGDALLFENRTWHAGGHNASGYTRKSVMFGYSYRWMRPDDYLTQDDELLQRCDPIQRQLLGGCGGLFEKDGSFTASGTERPLNDWCDQHGVNAAWKHLGETTHAL